MSLSTYYYDPFSLFTISDFGRLFDPRTPSTSRELSRSEDVPGVVRPRMDLYGSKDKNEMTAAFELPGLKKEDVDIEVVGNRLVVSGQASTSENIDEDDYALHERRCGRFSRTLPIPAGTKPEDIKAEMKEGVLTVKFPKSSPEKEAKKITVA
ncbi:small heat shock protein [Gautieria morchelliformis]|nr:small heat shock protein [Gautieria morchelliformis]